MHYGKLGWQIYYPLCRAWQKSEQVKKITVSIPIKVLEILTNERTRRQLKVCAMQQIVNCFVRHSCMLLLVSHYRLMRI